MLYRGVLAASFLLPLVISVARAEDDPEQRLREALKQSVSEMRAAQDQAAQATAQVAQLQADKTALQAQLDAAKATLAKAAKADDLKAAQTQLEQTRAEAAQTEAKWRDAYEQAATVARGKDAESRKESLIANSNTKALETCKATNKKLIDAAESVLHLYESQSFRNVLLKSYEPLVGTAKVDLENTIQDYDDKIRDQEYVERATPLGAPHK